MPDHPTYCPACDKHGVSRDTNGRHVKCGLTAEEARAQLFREARALREKADRLLRQAQDMERVARTGSPVRPTRRELLAMPPDVREPYLREAAEIAAADPDYVAELEESGS